MKTSASCRQRWASSAYSRNHCLFSCFALLSNQISCNNFHKLSTFAFIPLLNTAVMECSLQPRSRWNVKVCFFQMSLPTILLKENWKSKILGAHGTVKRFGDNMVAVVVEWSVLGWKHTVKVSLLCPADSSGTRCNFHCKIRGAHAMIIDTLRVVVSRAKLCM